MNKLENKKAHFKYQIDETMVCGIVLESWEVKALRAKQAQLTDGYAFIRNGEMFVVGLHCNRSKAEGQDPDRVKKLLAKKAEIRRLIGKVQEKGFTLALLNCFMTHKGLVKVTIGLAKGKNQFDKRQDVKDRESKIEQQRALKGRSRD